MYRLIPAALILLSGCTLLSPTKEEITLHGDRKSITLGDLERETQDLADRYAMGIAEACDRIRRESPDPALQRGTVMFKLRNATSAYDVVTAGDPLESLLDLVTLIELQNIVWLEENRIERYSATEGAAVLKAALTRSREDAWSLASRALTKDQLKEVRRVIHDWRRRNPDVQWVAFARFSAGTGGTGFNLINDLRSGLGGILNPFGSTNRSVDETRDLAAKALFYSKRLPILLGWETQAAAMNIAELPTVTRIEQTVKTLSETATVLPAEARALTRTVLAGLAALLGIALALALVYRRLSLSWQRKYVPARPPTRPLPTA